jgi:hypothetical protein
MACVFTGNNSLINGKVAHTIKADSLCHIKLPNQRASGNNVKRRVVSHDISLGRGRIM